RATGTIGTTKSAQQQLNVDRPAVRGRVHQQTDIVAVLATGDTTAQGTRRTGPHALGGDGNVCRRRFLLPERQTDTSQKPLQIARTPRQAAAKEVRGDIPFSVVATFPPPKPRSWRSEEHTSELQSRENLVCRLLLEKKKIRTIIRGLRPEKKRARRI